MRENIGFITICVIAVIAIALFAYFKGDSNSIKNIDFYSIEDTLKKENLAIVYFGKLTDEKKETIKKVIDDKDIKVYTSTASVEELNSMLIVNTITVDNNDIYVLFINADPVGYVVGTASRITFKETVDELFFDEIPTSKIAYIIPSSKDFIAKVKSKKYTVSVFGMNDCIHCTKFLPIINKIATDYNLEVSYFNKNTYNSDQYNEIMALDLKIPAKCTMDNKDTTMIAGFPKPMTIITKNGKLVDCIKGNVKESVVLDMLEKYEIIKRD